MNTRRPTSAVRPTRRARSQQTAPDHPSSEDVASPATSLTPPAETVLLAVTGMSPAVLTETVWALAHESEPVIPTRVIVLTTASGRDALVARLFAPHPAFGGRSAWDTLRDALAGEGHDLRGRLRFGTTPDDIRVITAVDPATGRSRELHDLRSPADNDAAANFLLEQVRTVVENPDTGLVASLAGGRKTMGALLYACLTLVGRETDRLTHVLVNEPFETSRDFFFPGQPGGPVREPHRPTSDTAPSPSSGASSDPATARVELADVPFVPLRNLFVRELGRKAGSFAYLVASCREQVRRAAGEQIRLTVEPGRCEIEVNGTRVRLAPLEQLLMLFLSRRAKHGEPAFGSYKEAAEALDVFRAEQVRAPKDFSDWRHADSLRQSVDEQTIRKVTSSLRDKLRRAGGNALLLAPCLPEKGRCSLEVPGPLIHLPTT